MIDMFLQFAVRQGQEEHIARLKHLARGEFQGGAFAQVWVLLVDKFAQVTFGGGLADFNIGVIEQQAQQLAAGITGCANDGNQSSCLILRVNNRCGATGTHGRNGCIPGNPAGRLGVTMMGSWGTIFPLATAMV